MAEVPLLLIFWRKANGPDLTIVKDELKSSNFCAVCHCRSCLWKLGTCSVTDWKLAKHFQFHYPKNILGGAKAYYSWCVFISTKIRKTPLHPWTKMTVTSSSTNICQLIISFSMRQSVSQNPLVYVAQVRHLLWFKK